MKMNKEEAFNVISQVCAIHQGNLQQHSAIQEALKVLKPEEPIVKKKE